MRVDCIGAVQGSVHRHDLVFRSKPLYSEDTGLVMAQKRLEEATFTWPAIKEGAMALNHAPLEALFAGLEWGKALEARAPAAAE